ncbi:MAG: dipeptidyl aminopeptidase/acylaminoacyl peptidase [Candidatus Krumholzibacteriia bacterium]|jgi:dipeptidyl aminopeptidase/acylaminoacyl peptidase
MKFLFRYLVSLFVLPFVLGASGALSAGLTPDQLLDLQHVRSAKLSPDGEYAAFTTSQNRALNDKPGNAWTNIWVMHLESQKVLPFATGKASASGPQFSPDGKYLSFLTTRGADAEKQVWVMPLHGGEAKAATDSPSGIAGYTWSADGNSFYYFATEAPTDREKELNKKGFNIAPFEEDLKSSLMSAVPFEYGVLPDSATVHLSGVAIWSIKASPDGQWIIYTASARNLIDEKYVFQDVYRLNLADGTSELIIDAPGKLGTYDISPDSKHLAWTGASSQKDHAVSTLFVCELDGSNNKSLTPENFSGHIRSAVWRDNKTLLYRADEGVYPTLSTISRGGDPEDRRVLLNGEKTGVIVGMPSTHPKAKNMVVVGNTPQAPGELYSWNGMSELKRLTNHNAVLDDVELGEQKVVTWVARDGLEIEGMLMMPVGYESGTFPLVVYVHGGPESNLTNGWLTRYAVPGQAFTAQGYGVFMPNYRGSTGRGYEFAMSSYGDPAGKEFDDIVDGLDHLIAEGLVDPDRVAVMGGSYGGFATNWLTSTYSDRFAAGATFVGVSDLVSKRFLTNIPYEDEYVHMGKPVREMWDVMHERSPVRHAEKNKTPLLILHGDRDHRVHFSQAQEMFRALKMSGHPSVRLIYYPGEGHGNNKRFGRTDFLNRVIAWFDYYLLADNPWDGPMPALDISEDLNLLGDWGKPETE